MDISRAGWAVAGTVTEEAHRVSKAPMPRTLVQPVDYSGATYPVAHSDLRRMRLHPARLQI
jgi:hypothetical protein